MNLIYTNENNPFTLKLLISANCAGQDLNLKLVNLQDSSIPQPKYLPCLLHADRNLFIANAASYYLFPPNQVHENTVNEWLEWESTVLSINLVNSFSQSGKPSKGALKNCFRTLNDAIGTNLSLTGDTLSVCDVVIWSTLYPFYKDINLCDEHLVNFENLFNWLKQLENLPNFQKSLSQYTVIPGNTAYQVLMASTKYTVVDGTCIGNENGLSIQNRTVDSVTSDEISSAKIAWLEDINKQPKPKQEKVPVLPIPGEKNILITSALPYVNNVPHLGNIIGCVLSADVFARFNRLCNHNTLYICGTDEYGTATETKALEENLTPQQICDKYFEVHNSIYRWFNIGFDYFGRTTTPEQTKITQDIFLQLNHNGFMQIQAVEQLLCEKCDRYLADRFVEGVCPHPGCNYEDARGDQCDSCGKLVNATELKNPKCKVCGNTPNIRQSNQFFLDLPKLEPLLRHWMDKSSTGWSNNARIIAKSWLKEGLKPRCITRDLKWGIPVPIEGYTNKVFYVWFDAPIGYLSISAKYTNEWRKWWQPESNTTVTLYQFMAKDNVPFHSVMFPAALLGLNSGYTVVSHIMATEYLNYEDGKFSKSRGTGVFGNDAQNTGIPSDVWRFYLLYVRPESQDSSFSWSDLATKNNSELLNNLGNFANRAQVFAEKFFNRTVPSMNLDEDDYVFLALCTRELKEFVNNLEKAKLREGIRHILAISRHGNQYMQSSAPWVLIKGTEKEKEKAGTVIGLCCNITCLLATLLFPYMPDTSRTLKKQLNAPESINVINSQCPEISMLLKSGHKLGKPFPLFTKIDSEKVEEMKKQFSGKQKIPQNLTQVEDIATLKNKIAAQGDKIRTLKASGVDKNSWQPEVSILLDLKRKLESALKISKNSLVENVKLSINQNGSTDDGIIKKLQEEIDKQAVLIRHLKSSGASKTEWQPQVKILLDLKAKLSTAIGGSQYQQVKKAK